MAKAKKVPTFKVKKITLSQPKPINMSVKTRIPGLRSILRGTKRG